MVSRGAAQQLIRIPREISMKRLIGITILVAAFLSACSADNRTSNPIFDSLHPSPVPVNTLTAQLRSTATRLFGPPVTLPKYIVALKPAPNEIAGSISCIAITISQREIWEPGDTAEEITNHLRSSFRLTINGQLVPVNAELLQFLLTLTEISEHGTPLGTFGGPMQTCVPVTLPKGLNMATVGIKTPADKAFSFSWAFMIE